MTDAQQVRDWLLEYTGAEPVVGCIECVMIPVPWPTRTPLGDESPLLVVYVDGASHALVYATAHTQCWYAYVDAYGCIRAPTLGNVHVGV